jgi:hypothetical protein
VFEDLGVSLLATRNRIRHLPLAEPPQIMQIKGVQGLPLVMELDRSKPVRYSNPEALPMGAPPSMAEALEAMRERGIVHHGLEATPTLWSRRLRRH